ncbi:MAG: recF [Acidimicrobiia bacterium]|nr:recF [Acidimicrobiia bacterium]
MILRHLRLVDFRNYTTIDVAPAPGLTVVVGSNGQGKTNLIEAVAYLSMLESFRGVPAEALVRDGQDRAQIRGEVEVDQRAVTVDATIARVGSSAVTVNGQRLRRARDLLGVVRCTVFTPDDLELVKGAPALRRQFLDQLLVALQPKMEQLRSDVDRVLRQRGNLLKQSGGRLTTDIQLTLDVWDTKLDQLGTALASARQRLVADLEPIVASAYTDVAGPGAAIGLRYSPSWFDEGLAAALVRTRTEDLRRGVTTVGPHRDDLEVSLHGASARTHASQGEQRSLALSLRLGGHALVTDRVGSPPILLLDDVFSELDPGRTAALVAHLPAGQSLLTTAERIPDGAKPELILEVRDGRLVS